MSYRSDIAARVATALTAYDPAIGLQSDINLPFTPTANWVRLTFIDGAETLALKGGTTVGARGPVLVYCDVFTPQGVGDGPATDIAEVIRVALRRLNVADVRWNRFEEGPEGALGADYRKQVVAVFIRNRRV